MSHVKRAEIVHQCHVSDVVDKMCHLKSNLTPEQRDFAGRDPLVVSFVGFSGKYDSQQDLTEAFEDFLRTHPDLKPENTIVNIGATASGIGALYRLAKRKGFTTTGIVSMALFENHGEESWNLVSSYVDHVFAVGDSGWGGFLKNLAGKETAVLSPTSAAIIAVSSIVVAIGGGPIACAEFFEAQRSNIPTYYYAADRSHSETAGDDNWAGALAVALAKRKRASQVRSALLGLGVLLLVSGGALLYRQNK